MDEPAPPQPGEKLSEDHCAPATRTEVFGWCMFDFANSSYTTLVVTVAFSAYFVRTVAGEGGQATSYGDLLWGVGNSVSQVIVLLTAPVVGAIADFSGAKKRFLLVTYLGCVATTAFLGWVGPGEVTFALTLYVVSNVFFSTGENLVAAFLPEITTPASMGRISGMGWALGYVGGLGCLLVCYPFMRDGFGPDNAASMRALFMTVALFFLLGGIPTFLFLRERASPQQLQPGQGYVSVGFRRVRDTLRHVRRYRQLFRFLVVFLVYNCGVLIVVAFAGIFALYDIGLDAAEFLKFFIIIQVSSSIGALVFGFVQDSIGAKRTILITLAIWIVTCWMAYGTTSVGGLYVVGNLAGLALGSSMSAGRALVGTFSPKERAGEFFGFWGLCWKLSGAIGPLAFGSCSVLVGRRIAILVTSLFFVLGMIGMLWIDEEEGRSAVEREP